MEKGKTKRHLKEKKKQRKRKQGLWVRLSVPDALGLGCVPWDAIASGLTSSCLPPSQTPMAGSLRIGIDCRRRRLFGRTQSMPDPTTAVLL